MKKSLLTLLGAGLLLTSCQSDEPFAPTEGGEKQVTFTLNVPGELGTRAASGESGAQNNQNADIYYTLVLDANGDKRVLQETTTEKTVTFTTPVVLGRKYDITAYASYTNNIDADASNIKAIAVEKSFNDETKDAYTAHVEDHDFALNALPAMQLKRPFGKLRLIATDYVETGTAKNTAIDQVTVTYNNTTVTTYDATTTLFNNVGTGISATKDFIKYYTDNTDGMPIFADYVPANREDNPITFTVTVRYAGSTETYSRTFNDIPVRRNALTTLKGNFFTAGAEITVKVEDAFDINSSKEYDLKFTAKEVQAALDAAPIGETTTIYLGATIEGDVIEFQKADDRHVIIDGMGNKWNGTIRIHNGSNYNNGTFTVKNVNFETSDAERNFIEALDNGSERYSNNITVEGCTFTSPATRSINEGVVGVQVKSSKNVKVLNCKANNIHSLLQAQSCDENVIVKDAKIKDCKNGVAFKAVKKAVVEGCEINVAGYGIRFDGNQNKYGITVKDNNVTAVQPLIVCKMTGQNNTIALEGPNTLTTEAEYQIVITKGSDDEAYVKPTGTYTLTGADDFTIFPKPLVAEVGGAEYDDINEAIANWTNGSTLTLLKNVTLKDVITLKSTEFHILDLGTYTMTAASGKDAISITAEGRSSASYALDIKADATNPGGITATSKAVVKTTGKSGVKDRPIIRFYNGVFNASNIISHSGSNGTNCPQFQFHGGVYNCNLSANRALIQIYGGTFNGRFYISVDSSAYALISGGKFKYMDNLYMSALNSDKFTIGSSKGNFDRGVYVDDEGYIVVGGPVITDFGDKFAAKATNVSKAGSYLPYSSAAEHGLYYINAEMAIAKHGAANVDLK